MCAICQKTECPSRCPNGERTESGFRCAHCNEPIEAGTTYFRIRYAEKVVHEECADNMTFSEIVALCDDMAEDFLLSVSVSDTSECDDADPDAPVEGAPH